MFQPLLSIHSTWKLIVKDARRISYENKSVRTNFVDVKDLRLWWCLVKAWSWTTWHCVTRSVCIGLIMNPVDPHFGNLTFMHILQLFLPGVAAVGSHVSIPVWFLWHQMVESRSKQGVDMCKGDSAGG